MLRFQWPRSDVLGEAAFVAEDKALRHDCAASGDPAVRASAGAHCTNTVRLVESHFFAYLYRLRLIQRWILMRSAVPRKRRRTLVSRRPAAHALYHRARDIFGRDVDAGQAVILALFRDAEEVLTRRPAVAVRAPHARVVSACSRAFARSNRSPARTGHGPEQLADALPTCHRRRPTRSRPDPLGQSRRYARCLPEVRHRARRWQSSYSPRPSANSKKKPAPWPCPRSNTFSTFFAPSFISKNPRRDRRITLSTHPATVGPVRCSDARQ